MTTRLPSGRLAEVVACFFKLGSTAFGGPAAHIAMMHAEVVKRLDAIAIGQVTPGPVFTTATFIGFLLGGGVPGRTVNHVVPGRIASAGGNDQHLFEVRQRDWLAGRLVCEPLSFQG